ncbi:hypothetical protein EF847_02920 [Actinobacteria bacterium YIM 96077]|uniref:Uncharacterized protein n=1 Tax=Phytoactinopolyspora halophila TaxID=1981511 RepID=A0A329QHK9_9ACTN|nr:PQQ-binding-like beta-propeller repeat protein [Phytoactinopolyspora halophila]AYY11827.1 hypothetical protein EF847_02920 [Actinobacteria bacterium YIM 96077]RAW09848.1 hypothetical protein DPM12_20095 [Phytoactinopolyspora halophila]
MPEKTSPRTVAPTGRGGKAVSRRAMLVGSGVGALGLAFGGRLHAVAGGESDRFAMVTDVHINAEEPERTADLERIMRHIEDRNPAFVLNCGDVTDLGLAEEFEHYLSAIPSGLKSRMRAVPGNHEQQWLVDAFESYDHYLGRTRYSFNAAGFHVVGLDPLVMQEWGWYFDRELLDWLERDLKHAPKDVPILLFLHFPLGNDWNYVHNDDELLRVIGPYPVRGIFTGHAHITRISAYNGATEVLGNSLKSGPYYYWAERTTGSEGPVLEITEVTVPAEGDARHELLGTVPLSEPGPGGALGPLKTKATVHDSEVEIRVDLPNDGSADEVLARPHSYQYGGIDDEWTSLDQTSGRRWTGRVDAAHLPPGPHKIQVRAVGADGAVFDDTVPFELPSSGTRVNWTTQLNGRVQGALARHDDLVVAATTEGYVAGFLPTARAKRPRWRTRIGPVYKGPVFTPDGAQILVPSADHHLYALDPSRGTTQWSTSVGAPIASDVSIAEVDGHPRAFVAAGTDLFCLDLDGQILWSADMGGIVAGRAACDGQRVYMGSGNGYAYAFDAGTGEQLWSTQLTDRDTTYGQVLYGPWACHVLLLPDGAPMFTTFTNAHALDAATGERRWDGPGDELGLLQLLYTPPTLTEHGILLVDGFNGTVHLLDPDSGEQTWEAEALPRNFGAAPVPSPDEDSVYWLVGQSGLLVRIDLANREVNQALQVMPVFTQSTSVVLGSGSEQVLVVGGQDGRLRGVVGLHA